MYAITWFKNIQQGVYVCDLWVCIYIMFRGENYNNTSIEGGHQKVSLREDMDGKLQHSKYISLR